jgi:hypothetical protein
MALLAVSAVAVVGLLVVVDLLAASAVAGLLAAVSAREGLPVVVDFVGVGFGAQVGAGGDPASMAPIAGGVRVAAVGSAHTIDRRAVGRGKWERRLAPVAPIIHERRLPRDGARFLSHGATARGRWPSKKPAAYGLARRLFALGNSATGLRAVGRPETWPRDRP